MSIYKFRVLIENKDIIYRDIEIKNTQNLEELHQIILKSFGFDNSQMASFYLSNEDWEKGQEIALFDMHIQENEGDKVLTMADTEIKAITNSIGDHLLYTYDFLNMWNFFIELIEVAVKENDKDYPQIVDTEGEAPLQDSKNNLITDEDIANELLEVNGVVEKDDDPFKDDIFEGFDDFEDYQ